MSIVTKIDRAHADTHSIMYAPQIPGLVAGEDLPPASMCKIDATTGKVMLAADGDDFAGMNLDDKKAGEPVTLYGVGATYQYTAPGGLTPGQKLYLAAAADKGKLNNAVVTAGVRPVAQAVDGKHIRIVAAI